LTPFRVVDGRPTADAPGGADVDGAIVGPNAGEFNPLCGRFADDHSPSMGPGCLAQIDKGNAPVLSTPGAADGIWRQSRHSMASSGNLPASRARIHAQEPFA
jgi:hypothetical protein